MKDTVIHAREVGKSFRSGSVSTSILRGVDLDVQRGECVFLAGPSGSGKTTLLSILGCVLSSDEGHIRILGQDITCFEKKQQARFRRQMLGFVFQRFHLFRGLRVWENVRVAYDLLGVTPTVAKRESHRLLEAVGLADKASCSVNQLSVGQQQRVALARALAGDPEIVLADEPTASLDAKSGLNAMELLRQLASEEGKTIVVVTHDLCIFHLADRVLHLEDGSIARECSGEQAAIPSLVFATNETTQATS